MKKRKKVLKSKNAAKGLETKGNLKVTSDEVSFRRALRLVADGRIDRARSIYQQLQSRVTDTRLKALVCNDLAALSAESGDVGSAREGIEAALEIDSQCQPACANKTLLEADRREEENRSRIRGPTTAPVSNANQIKIAVLSFLFNWPSTGGGIVHTVELIRFLMKAGYEARHIYARNSEWGVGKVEGILPFPSEVLEFDSSTWNVPEIQTRFRKSVAMFDPDYVMITDSWNSKPILAEAVHNYPYVLRFQAMECLCPLNNVRLLADDGGGFRQCTRNQLATPDVCHQCLIKVGRRSGSLHQAERALCGVGSPEYQELLLRTLREAEAVLVVNPLHEAMISAYAERVRVVTAGMDPARFPWPPPQHLARANKDRKQVLFAGLVEETIKGYAILHEACQQLWQTRQDFQLIATGDPPGQPDPFTRFIGWQTQEELPRQIQSADMLVMPTIAQEALGRTAVEAMAGGIPVIASRLGGLPFTVVDGVTGLLCEPGDSVDLAKKIKTLLDDPDLSQQLGLAGRRRFEQEYSWDVIINRHYRPIFARKRNRAVLNPLEVPLLAEGRQDSHPYPAPLTS